MGRPRAEAENQGFILGFPLLICVVGFGCLLCANQSGQIDGSFRFLDLRLPFDCARFHTEQTTISLELILAVSGAAYFIVLELHARSLA